MHNDYNQIQLNATRYFKNSQDQNATAIDSMLVSIRSLMKKILLFRKYLKQFSEIQFLLQAEINENLCTLQKQSHGLNLTLPGHIPPDKRMTGLFYMRLCKEVNLYKTVLQGLTQILPIIAQNYQIQNKDAQYSIASLYLICEKRIVQQIILLKRKSIKRLNQLHEKNKLMEKQKMASGCATEKISNAQSFQANNTTYQNKIKIYQSILFKKTSDFQAKASQVASQALRMQQRLPRAMRSQQKAGLFEDFSQRIPIIFSKIYSCLDLGIQQIIQHYVPTLRPQDNIDIIYSIVSHRNKKSRKQIKQFNSEYILFVDRRAYMKKRRQMRKKQKQSQSIGKFLKIHKQTSPPITIQKAKSGSFKNSEEPDTKLTIKQSMRRINSSNVSSQSSNNGSVQSKRPISKFRQRIQLSIQNSKQNDRLITGNLNSHSDPKLERNRPAFALKYQNQVKEKEKVLKDQIKQLKFGNQRKQHKQAKQAIQHKQLIQKEGKERKVDSLQKIKRKLQKSTPPKAQKRLQMKSQGFRRKLKL